MVKFLGEVMSSSATVTVMTGVLGVSVTGGNIALRAGKQPIKNVIARHCELTKFDYWYCFFISAVK
ncbi:hypothetical protein RZ87_13710 [Enterobacter roggenkampii]|nr:hypothetical protein RZ87_13710 [Enterobacter roggenkampii]